MSATGLKKQYFDYALFYTNITCLSDVSCSGLWVFNMNTNINPLSNNLNLLSGGTILNNFTSINTPLYINTNQSTMSPALNIDSTTNSIMVNIIK